MKKLLLFVAILYFGTTFSQTTTFEWAKSIGGQNYDEANAITLDTQGNVYVTGRFQKFVGTQVDFDPGPGVFNIAAIGQYDAFIVKLTATGDFVWAKNFGGGGSVSGNGIAVDSNGNVYTTGTFTYNCDFNPSSSADFTLTAFTLFGNDSTDAYISKLDSNGNFVWAKKIGAQFFDTGIAITTDVNNNVYVTGKYSGTVNFNTSGGTFELTGVLSSSGYILKLDSNGNFGWAKSVSGTGAETVYDIAVDTSGNVFATGDFYSGTDLNPGTAVVNLSGTGIYILKLDINGNFMFVKGFAGDATSAISCTAIKIDLNGNIYTTGSFRQIVDFDPGVSTFNLAASASTGQDAFLSKLDNLGNFVWARRIYTLGADFSRALALDNLGNIYIAPNLERSTFNIDSGPAITASTTNSSTMSLLKFDNAGTLIAKNFIDSLQNRGIAVDAIYNVYTTGTYASTVDFNPDVAVFNLTANQSTDFFISKVKLRIEVLGTQENNKLNLSSVYPNPTSDNLNLKLPYLMNNGTIKIISLAGQTVFEQQKLNGTDFKFDVAKLNSGLYLVQISDAEHSYTSKFIRQ